MSSALDIYISIMHDPYHVYLDLDVINNNYQHDGSPPICGSRRSGTRLSWMATAPSTSAVLCDLPFRLAIRYRSSSLALPFRTQIRRPSSALIQGLINLRKT